MDNQTEVRMKAMDLAHHQHMQNMAMTGQYNAADVIKSAKMYEEFMLFGGTKVETVVSDFKIDPAQFEIMSGDTNKGIYTDLEIENAARICHELNRIWCEFNHDYSQPVWELAPDWQRESAINGVLFHIQNPDAGDDASHENWRSEKRADGWTWGETKDPEAKKHPCMVAFRDLPSEQRFKDTLFRTTVHQVLKL